MCTRVTFGVSRLSRLRVVNPGPGSRKPWSAATRAPYPAKKRPRDCPSDRSPIAIVTHEVRFSPSTKPFSIDVDKKKKRNITNDDIKVIKKKTTHRD